MTTPAQLDHGTAAELPQNIAERCLAAHRTGQRWLECLKSILPTLNDLAGGSKAVFADLKGQALHLWSSGETSGRLPPESGLQPEPKNQASDTVTVANIRHCKLPEIIEGATK